MRYCWIQYFWVVVSSCHFFINSFSTDMARQIIFLVPKQIDKAEPKESAYILLMAAGCILKLQLPVQSCRRWKPGWMSKLSSWLLANIGMCRWHRSQKAWWCVQTGCWRDRSEKRKWKPWKLPRCKGCGWRKHFTEGCMVPVCQRGRWTTDYYRNKMIRQLELHLFPFVGDKNIRKTKRKGLIDILRGCRKNEQGRQSHDLYGQGVIPVDGRSLRSGQHGKQQFCPG